MPKPIGFFVSYNQVDREWAEWLAWQLEDAGYDVFIQAWDIRPGQNFVAAMQHASQEAARTIAVLSPDYLNAKFTQPEWTAAFAQDPTGEKGLLVPVRVQEVELRGMWISLVYIDLVGLSKDEARQVLLHGIKVGRVKPDREPPFPGPETEPKHPIVRKEPAYPVAGPVLEDLLKHWTVLDALTNEEGAIGYLFRQEDTRSVILEQIEISAMQRALIDQMIALAQSSPQNNNIQRSLFGLLIPGAFWESLSAATRLLVVVDRQSAKYPWELLTDPSSGVNTPPLAVRTGMLRNLAVESFRTIATDLYYSREALVIGNPRTTLFPPLPGAAFEAQAVSDVFSQSGSSVHTLIDTDPLEIVNTLFATQYRILHITSHAIYDPVHPERSGIVMGDGIYLTTAEISQLRTLPDVVYINCGHVPTIDAPLKTGDPEVSQPRSPHGEFAAAFADQLIRLGVRALIISGWAVEDRASVTFATQFYETLLSGKSFAESIYTARRLTYEHHRESNTWGAFQCYGNPDFRL